MILTDSYSRLTVFCIQSYSHNSGTYSRICNWDSSQLRGSAVWLVKTDAYFFILNEYFHVFMGDKYHLFVKMFIADLDLVFPKEVQ